MELHRKLKVEEARLRSPERIMRIAQQRGLVMPDSKQVVVIP
jgi:cell division protein FtsL